MVLFTICGNIAKFVAFKISHSFSTIFNKLSTSTSKAFYFNTFAFSITVDAFFIGLFPKLTAATETIEHQILTLKIISDMGKVIIPYACCKFALMLSGKSLTTVNLTIVFNSLLVYPARLASRPILSSICWSIYLIPDNLVKAEKRPI